MCIMFDKESCIALVFFFLLCLSILGLCKGNLLEVAFCAFLGVVFSGWFFFAGFWGLHLLGSPGASPLPG